MSDSKSTAPRPVGKVATAFVGLTGLASLAVGAVGNFTRENSATNIAFIIVGITAVVIAPVLPRLQKLELKATGATVNLGASEEQIKNGQLVEAHKVSTPEVAVTDGATPYAEKEDEEPVKVGPAGRRPAGAGERVPAAPAPPRVFLTASAVSNLGLLSASDRTAVERAVANMPYPGDPRAIEQGSGGRSYFVHSVGSVKLFYRQLDKTTPDEPDRYVVLDIKAA